MRFLKVAFCIWQWKLLRIHYHVKSNQTITNVIHPFLPHFILSFADELIYFFLIYWYDGVVALKSVQFIDLAHIVSWKWKKCFVCFSFCWHAWKWCQLEGAKSEDRGTEAPRHHSSLAGGSRGQAVTRNSKRFTVLATPVRQPKLSLIDSNFDNFVTLSNPTLLL